MRDESRPLHILETATRQRPQRRERLGGDVQPGRHIHNRQRRHHQDLHLRHTSPVELPVMHRQPAHRIHLLVLRPENVIYEPRRHPLSVQIEQVRRAEDAGRQFPQHERGRCTNDHGGGDAPEESLDSGGEDEGPAEGEDDAVEDDDGDDGQGVRGSGEPGETVVQQTRERSGARVDAETEHGLHIQGPGVAAVEDEVEWGLAVRGGCLRAGLEEDLRGAGLGVQDGGDGDVEGSVKPLGVDGPGAPDVADGRELQGGQRQMGVPAAEALHHEPADLVQPSLGRAVEVELDMRYSKVDNREKN